MSVGGRQFNSEKMINNLKELIAKSEEERRQLKTSPSDSTGRIAVGIRLVSKENLEQEKMKFKDKAKKEEQKDKNKKVGGESTSKKKEKSQKKQIRRKESRSETIPSILVPDDLIGKKVLHYCVGDDDELEWYEGIVGDVNGGGTEIQIF